MDPHRGKGLATAAELAGLERHEVVDGEIVEKAAPSGEHSGTQACIVGSLFGFHGRGGAGRRGGWWLHTECEIELGPHEVYLPDVAGWRVERCPERPRGKPVRIAPDWVAEVLSPSTADRDRGPKLRGYHRAEVGHYWLVDTERQELRVLRWHADDYHVVLIAGPGDIVRAEPFEAVELDIGILFGE